MSILNEPTVLVLGAGASNPYGFPLGPGLKERLLARHSHTLPVHLQTLRPLGYDTPDVTAFCEALRYGTHETIDVFLERKTKFRELGSYLIALTLQPFEKPEHLFPQRNWYGALFDALAFEKEEPRAEQLSVVTLNYDRSLEYFLDKNIDYNCRDEIVESAHEKRKKIRVVHAHGSLGAYPARPYGRGLESVEELSEVASRIRIMSDRLDDSTDFRKAQRLIAEAKNVVFLGFGYHEETLSALVEKADTKGQHVYGTSVGLGNTTMSRLQATFGDSLTVASGEGCDELLRRITAIGVE